MNYYKKTSIGGQVIIGYMADSKRVEFPEDEGNTDYQEYLAWLAEGNEPEVIEPEIIE